MRVNHARLKAAEGKTLGPPGTDYCSLEVFELEDAAGLVAIATSREPDECASDRPGITFWAETDFPQWVGVWATLLQMREGQG